jgi:hypothetical protein
VVSCNMKPSNRNRRDYQEFIKESRLAEKREFLQLNLHRMLKQDSRGSSNSSSRESTASARSASENWKLSHLQTPGEFYAAMNSPGGESSASSQSTVFEDRVSMRRTYSDCTGKGKCTAVGEKIHIYVCPE